jgi:hypothetical protein
METTGQEKAENANRNGQPTEDEQIIKVLCTYQTGQEQLVAGSLDELIRLCSEKKLGLTLTTTEIAVPSATEQADIRPCEQTVLEQKNGEANEEETLMTELSTDQNVNELIRLCISEEPALTIKRNCGAQHE